METHSMESFDTQKFEIRLKNINTDAELDTVFSIVTGEARTNRRIEELNAQMEKEDPKAYKDGMRYYSRPKS